MELATMLLSKFPMYIMDDYTAHLWTLEELTNNVKIEGHKFFDYNGWCDEMKKKRAICEVQHMARNSPHNKIIKKAANEILAPIGLFQEGQSRRWVDDNGWFVIYVEFQPSDFSKGSYLNVGISFLWDKAGMFSDLLAFEIGDRCGYGKHSYVEYIEGQDDIFYTKMLKMAEKAKEQVLRYRKFNNLEFCFDQMELLALTKGKSTWTFWNTAMFCFLIKDINRGKIYLKRVVDRIDTNHPVEWYNNVKSKGMELLNTDSDLTNFVLESIHKKRALLKSKRNFKKLGEWDGSNFA
jgi:hypothetical protein